MVFLLVVRIFSPRLDQSRNNSADLAACHSAPQDDTPTEWDTNYYKQTQANTAPRGVYRFDADVNLANATTASGQAFTEFGNSLGKNLVLSSMCPGSRLLTVL